MLTHDVEPIIDTIKSLSQKFNNQTSASFLKLSGGKLEELAIAKDDIQTFSQICNSALESDKDEIIKLIYLRRYYEILDDKGNVYHVLSNLFHKRVRAIDTREQKGQNGEHPEMVKVLFMQGCTEIRDKIVDFSYADILKEISDIQSLKLLYKTCQNSYEKLQLFRFLDLDIQNSVVQKFINETYHIENDFICQLDPTKFDTVPEYVIEECSKALEGATA